MTNLIFPYLIRRLFSFPLFLQSYPIKTKRKSHLRTGDEGDRERVRESVGIVKRESGAIRQRLAVVDKTVVVVNTLEDSWVNQLSRAEPTAADVDPRNNASRHTHVRYLYRVTWYSVRHWFRCCLVHHYVRTLALISDSLRLCPPFCFSFFKTITNKQRIF